jgi:hypothetical protein
MIWENESCEIWIDANPDAIFPGENFFGIRSRRDALRPWGFRLLPERMRVWDSQPVWLSFEIRAYSIAI